MKKSKLCLFLPFMVLITAFCTSGTRVNNNQVINSENVISLKASSSVVNEEKVYTYNNNVATYTFKLDTETKKAYVSYVNKFTQATGSMEGTFTLENSILIISVNDEELFKFEILQDGTLKLKADSFTDKINNLVQTFIVPLTAGLSVTSVITLVVSLTFAILNRKNNITSKNNVLDMSKVALESVKQTNECIKLVKEQNLNTTEAIKVFTNQTDKIINNVATVTEQTELLDKLKVSHANTVHALYLIASNTKELVTSGVANEVKEIEAESKEL